MDYWKAHRSDTIAFAVELVDPVYIFFPSKGYAIEHVDNATGANPDWAMDAKVVFELAFAAAFFPEGELEFARWGELLHPEAVGTDVDGVSRWAERVVVDRNSRRTIELTGP